MIYPFHCVVSRKLKYQILLKDSSWYKNLYGNAWCTFDSNDAEYQLSILRKRGLV